MNKISKINISLSLKVVSRIALIVLASMMICTILAAYYKEDTTPYLYTILVLLPVIIISFLNPKIRKAVQKRNKRDPYLIVTFSWIVLGIAGSLPYLFNDINISFTDAFFESVSGFTTTGSSILTDIEALPKGLLFWRSMTHWIGGIGIIVLVILIMPGMQIGGYQLFSKESSLQEKISPKAKSAGFRLLLIYIGLTIAEVIFLLLGKMSLFESVCHAFGTVATGGFSPKNTSIAEYSPYIQYVIMFFMLLAGTNFTIHYLILHGKIGKVLKNEELRLYLFAVLVIGTIISLGLYFYTERSIELALRSSFFQVISTITCTGFASDDYMLWPNFLWIMIFFTMFLGGSTGSTAGGIKISRHLIFAKNIRRRFILMMSPLAVLPIRYNYKSISEESNSKILNFIGLYLIVFLLGSLSLTITGVDLQTAAGAAATSMAGIGPGIGSVGPTANFYHLPITAKYILIFLMILGRLELFTVLILFSRSFRRAT